jgi:hypothetical protein
VYHYTAWAKLFAIVVSGELRPSAAGAPGERPLLWFSAHGTWEPTATKLLNVAGKIIEINFDEMVERFGAIRFGLRANDPALWYGRPRVNTRAPHHTCGKHWKPQDAVGRQTPSTGSL